MEGSQGETAMSQAAAGTAGQQGQCTGQQKLRALVVSATGRA